MDPTTQTPRSHFPNFEHSHGRRPTIKLASWGGSFRSRSFATARLPDWVAQLGSYSSCHLSEDVMARAACWLTPPTRLTFIVSVILVILALLVHYAPISIPVVGAHVFETLLIGYLVLLVGNLFRGL